MAAALIYACKIRISKTDVPQSWLKHPKKRDDSIRLWSDFFPEKRQDYAAVSKPVTTEDVLNLRTSLLEKKHVCGATWILSAEPNDDSTASFRILCISTKILLNLRFLLLRSKFERLTVGQRENVNWARVCNGRLTAR